jgi:glycosyltransferase involved in cell wall biosynthesis
MSSPTISVIIPCFNHGEFLPEAVASVTAVKRDDVEIIIVDDGSTDELTRKEMDELTARGIHVVRQENKGLAAARNAGIRVSKGEYIIPLDADNHLRSSYIEHGIRILDANPEVGVVYGDAEYIGIRTGPWRVGPFERNRLLQGNYIDACAIYRRSVWELNKGYDSGMPVQGVEDWDFWLGALEHGWQFTYVPEILFDYRVAKESMITRTRGFGKQIEEFIATKHGPLYRQAWLELARQENQESLKWTLRNLRRLLRSRFRAEIQRILDRFSGHMPMTRG